MVGAEAIEVNEKDRFVEVIVSVSAPLITPQRTKETAARIIALQAAGADISDEVITLVRNRLKFRQMLTGEDFDGAIHLVEIVSKGKQIQRGASGSVQRFTLRVPLSDNQ